MAHGLPDELPKYSLGWGVIEWMNTYLVQPNGVRAGEPFFPTDLQAHFYLWHYAVNENGKWIYRRSTMRAAKGTGKVSISASMSWAELLGPVRFDRWGTDEDGNKVPIGKPVDLPLVALGANTEYQTSIVFSMVAAMAPKGSRIRSDYELDVQRTQVFYPPKSGKLICLSSSAGAAEGFPYTFAALDEQEHATASNGGVELDRVVKRNLGKTDGRLLTTENAFALGAGSVAEVTYDAYMAQEAGRTKNRDILYVAPQAPADTDMADEDSLRRGLAVAYTDATWAPIDRIVAECQDVTQPREVLERFYLNHITASDTAWISPTDWDALADSDTPLQEDDEVVLFFDGSRVESTDPTRDTTALVACRVSDGYVSLLGLSAYGDGSTTADVERWISHAFEYFHVAAFFADLREWEAQILTTWPEQYGDQVTMWSNSTGKAPTPFAWDMRSKSHDFTLATEAVYAEIMEKQFHHDGVKQFSQHVYNATRRPNRYGIAIGKESPNSPRKIDAAVCMIGARMVRRLLLASPEYQKRSTKRTGRVYGF